MQRQIVLRILIVLFFFCSSCRREEHPVPYAPVNLVLYASDPEFVPLNAVGGSMHYWGGSRGLIIYRKSPDEFNVFDRHCPFQVDNPCGIITIDGPGSFSATDTCCGSKFLLIDGSVQQGPAQIPLRAYPSQWDGIRLVVTN
jgi:nitrite reductase/ring-hydroxylating ferredoxin subunit